MGQGFDQYAPVYDEWFLKNRNVLFSEVHLVASTLRKARHVLSVGCGSGLFEKIMREQFGNTVSDGIEPSPGMAEIARQRGLNVTVISAEDYEFPKDKYDTILFNGSPSYIRDLEGVLRKVYEALPAGGRVILVDVPKESTYGIMYNLAKALGTWDHPLLEGTYPPDPYPIEFVKEANWRTTAEKADMLKRIGFTGLTYSQTLTSHPLYSNVALEMPSPGHDRGDYVAITATK